MRASPGKYQVLIVDDEPDVYAVTQLALKGMRYRKEAVVLRSAATGQEAVQALRSDPSIAVILLDVVMETDTAGLDACRAIRTELKNRFARILLRTGQPGQAPERKVIDEYDLDGYLAKAEMTSTRLYSAVRTALKAWEELVELDRYRRYLAAIHDCALALYSFNPLQATLERILQTAVAICPTALAVLGLETFEREGNPRRCLLHLSTDPDPLRAEAAARAVQARVARDPGLRSRRDLAPLDNGVLVPLVLHRDLGHGWLFLADVAADELAGRALTLLAGHAVNALYSSVAQELLAAREAASPDVLAV